MMTFKTSNSELLTDPDTSLCHSGQMDNRDVEGIVQTTLIPVSLVQPGSAAYRLYIAF